MQDFIIYRTASK